jgi:D-serine deaminase-like pyridoxal phosphate-dependent protein
MEKLKRPDSMVDKYIGKDVQELPTPALVVDLPLLQANIKGMQQLVSSYGKALRPHIKTHKCSRVAQMQIQAGAIGITCATVGEAEAMASAGIQDILIANQVVTPDKLDRVADLLRLSAVKFVVDSTYGIEAAERVAQKRNCQFEVLVEVDSGGNRCGAQSPQEAALLAKRIVDSPWLHFGGIQAYNGGTSYIKDMQEREKSVAQSDRGLAESIAEVRKVCDLPRISGAGAGNARFHLENGLLTEIQSGSYVYSDTTYRELAPEYRPALFVLSTIISRPLEGRVIMDVGLKTIGTEFSDPQLVDYPQLKDCRFSEEHLQWQVDHEPAPQIGEKVMILPSHCCTTVNLHRQCFAVQDRKVVDVWEIDAF